MDIADIANNDIETLEEMHLRNYANRQSKTITITSGKRYCIDCGEEIPAERLRAVPGALRCCSCQMEYEKRH